MTESASTLGGVATITRVFDAPRELVWKMFCNQAGRLPAEQYPLIEQDVSGFYDRLAAYLTSA